MNVYSIDKLMLSFTHFSHCENDAKIIIKIILDSIISSLCRINTQMQLLFNKKFWSFVDNILKCKIGYGNFPLSILQLLHTTYQIIQI